MADLIDRQKVIDAINAQCDEWENARGGLVYAQGLRAAIPILDTMPTIEPDRKKGKWNAEFNGAFRGGAYWFSCSECKRIVPEVRNGGWNFCPSCGADMRGNKNE